MNKHRASDTALLIARSLLLAEKCPDLKPLLADDCIPLTRRLLSTANEPGWFELCLRHTWLRHLLFAVERATLPGIFLHYLVRKNRIDHISRAAIKNGSRQLIVLGAGLDTLAWRKARQSSLPCFEIDHPATQAIKSTTFAREKNVPVLIPADLSVSSLITALNGQPTFDSATPSLWIAEGLLMYLSPGRVNKLVRELSTLAPPGSAFIFTFMETRPRRPLSFHNARFAVNAWLRIRGEPFQWGLPRHEVSRFAQDHGWQLDYLSSPDELRASILSAHHLQHVPLAQGESIALLTKPTVQ